MDANNFLNKREIFILENYPAMSYRAIGEKLGISTERVRQIKVAAERKIREWEFLLEWRRREEYFIILTLRRNDLWLITRSLEQHYFELSHKENHEDSRFLPRVTSLIEKIKNISGGRDLFKEVLDERQSFALKSYPLMTYKAIGEQLGVSSATAKRLRLRAIERIRAEKQKEYTIQAGQNWTTLVVRKKELRIIEKSLLYYEVFLSESDEDPDMPHTQELTKQLSKII